MKYRVVWEYEADAISPKEAAMLAHDALERSYLKTWKVFPLPRSGENITNPYIVEA